MEQEIVTANEQPEESVSLGERYNLGALEAAYNVSYTRGDVRRYRRRVFISSFIMFYFVLLVVLIVLAFTIPVNRYYWFLFLPFIGVANSFSIIYNIASHRKWGNRPLIGPRDRYQRVYIYAGGIVKQTNRSSEAVRWADIFKVVYIPLQASNGQRSDSTKNVASAGTAGIDIRLHGGKHLLLSGLLQNIDDLAYRLNQKHGASNYQF